MTRRTLLDFFEDFTQRDDMFIVHDDGYRVRQLTYRDLASEARRFAARLAEAGIGPDQKVVVWSENRPEWVIALWGCLLARVVIVPVDFRASPDLVKRYPKAAARDYDGRPDRITEADALIAYLQMLGTLVDFRLYDDKANMR